VTGEVFDADTAYRWGLVNRVVPSGDEVAAALSLADRIAMHPPLAVAAALRTARDGLDGDGWDRKEKERAVVRAQRAVDQGAPEASRVV
jgi:enoyl-CoA hydratase/carnithine racemase